MYYKLQTLNQSQRFLDTFLMRKRFSGGASYILHAIQFDGVIVSASKKYIMSFWKSLPVVHGFSTVKTLLYTVCPLMSLHPYDPTLSLFKTCTTKLAQEMRITLPFIQRSFCCLHELTTSITAINATRCFILKIFCDIKKLARIQFNHEAAAPDVAVVNTSQYLEAPIRPKLAQIIRSNKGR